MLKLINNENTAMETNYQSELIEDESRAQSRYQTARCTCPMCSSFEKTLISFLDDRFFEAILENLSNFRAYYKTRPVNEVVNAIS